MADNTEEEHLDNLLDNQPKNPPNEIIPAADVEAINPNQETENMEVHHHPGLHHKSKPWKECLLEGLMIFIAVTMGVFAESLKEHFGDKEKERQNIENVLRCLKTDTASLNRIITGNKL
jgi:hypothetical protein